MSVDALHEWEGRTVEEWRRAWRVPRLMAFADIASTNDVARALADQGSAAGTLVMADYQSAGRGRVGRSWIAQPGDSLLLSFLLRPEAADGDSVPGTAPVRVGLAVARAVRDVTGIAVSLKWPNDLTVPGGAKLAGILCEAATGGGSAVIIAGIGINVHQRATDWPPDRRGLATSVAAMLGRDVPGMRPRLAEAVAHALQPLFTRPLEPLHDDELSAYAAFDALRGVPIVTTGAAELHGVAAGLAPDGALLVRTASGSQRVTAGTVRTASRAVTPRDTVARAADQ